MFPKFRLLSFKILALSEGRPEGFKGTLTPSYPIHTCEVCFSSVRERVGWVEGVTRSCNTRNWFWFTLHHRCDPPLSRPSGSLLPRPETFTGGSPTEGCTPEAVTRPETPRTFSGCRPRQSGLMGRCSRPPSPHTQ